MCSHNTREKAKDDDFLGTAIQASHQLELHDKANYSCGYVCFIKELIANINLFPKKILE